MREAETLNEQNKTWERVALEALIKYAEGLQKLEYVGADVLLSFYKRKLEELEKS